MAKRKATAPTAGDGADLLAAIRARPDEDTPRLIYADWLDENKQPDRAEFIRVQCALARGNEYDADRVELQLREQQLLTASRKSAWGELPVKPVKEKTFARGFVDSISAHAATFLAGTGALFDAVPVRELRPLKIGPAWSQLLASPHLLRVRALDLHSSAISRKRAAELADSPNLAGLHELNLGANGTFGADGLRAVLASPHLRELRTLHLNNCHLGNEALAAFVDCKSLPNLRHLNLSGNGIGPIGAAHLARAGWLAQLDRLEIESNPLTDAGLRTLADAGLFARLARLDLLHVGLTCEGLRALGRSDKLSALRELRLDATNGDALEAVAEAPAFARLTALRTLEGTKVTDAGIRALLRSPLAAHLRALLVVYPLGPTDFARLMSARELSKLEWLSANGSSLNKEEKIDIAAVLRDATQFTNLHKLSLRAGWMTDDDLIAFAGCAHFANLADLRVQNGNVTATGMDPFLESPHFARLRRVHLPLKSYTLNDPIRARINARFGDAYSYY
jgi:uncharacterized protein (TIGR02996 family)